MVIVRHARPRNRLRRRSCEPKSDLPRSAKIGPGLRFYSPKLGRWPSRDPIEEKGGVHLYGFVADDPLNEKDLMGLARCCVRRLVIVEQRFFVERQKRRFRRDLYGFGLFVKFDLQVDPPSTKEDCQIRQWRQGWHTYHVRRRFGRLEQVRIEFPRTLDRPSGSDFWWDGSSWFGGGGRPSTGTLILPDWPGPTHAVFYDTPGKAQRFHTVDEGGYPFEMNVNFDTEVMDKASAVVVATLRWHFDCSLRRPPTSGSGYAFWQTPFGL